MENIRMIEAAPNVGNGEEVMTDFNFKDQKNWQEVKKDHASILEAFVSKDLSVSALQDSHMKK